MRSCYCSILAIAFSLLPAALFAQAVPESFSLVRADIAAGDSAVARLSGAWPNGCVPYRHEVARSGSEVTITMVTAADDSPATILCTAAFQPWSLTVDLGRFSAGTYSVRAQFRTASVAPRGPLTLRVAAAQLAQTMNVSDAWFAPDEAGWGLTLIEQETTTFATWYVYNAVGQPVWLVMPAGRRSGNAIEGEVYDTRGTAADLAWRAGATSQPAGRARFDFFGNDRAQLAYSFAGRPVLKSITRLNVAPVARNTVYAAMVSGEIFVCTIERGRVDLARYLELSLTPSASNPGLSALRFVDRPQIGAAGAVICTYTGEVSQSGSVAAGSGRYTCADGNTATANGPFTISNMRVQDKRVGFDLAYQNGICEFRGRVVGVEPPD